jgi:SAM-dependent methyltransferase
MGDANTRWAASLARWAIPDALVAAAPAPPYIFDPAVFTAAADDALAREADSPSDRVARAALPAGGSVLDVGAGAGAASLRLRPGRIVAVDPSAELLAALGERAGVAGIPAVLVEDRWPDAAPRAPAADVVVCHHVAYNVPDLAAFATALDGHAARRVVVELTAVHPLAWMAPYWMALHGLPRPDEPTADDAIAVLVELGLEVHDQRWQRDLQMIGESTDDAILRIARRLCLPADRLPELRAVVADTPPPTSREVVTLWWDRLIPS